MASPESRALGRQHRRIDPAGSQRAAEVGRIDALVARDYGPPPNCGLYLDRFTEDSDRALPTAITA